MQLLINTIWDYNLSTGIPHNTRVTDRILYVSDDVSELGKRSYVNRNKKKEKDRHSKKKGALTRLHCLCFRTTTI